MELDTIAAGGRTWTRGCGVRRAQRVDAMYGQVKFLLVDENVPIVVPANAFLFRTAGPQVASIGNENRVHWQLIRVGRELGDRIEVLDDLKENTKNGD